MTDRKPYYITTPIYYPNSNLHIGNTYTSIIADVLKRYKTLLGYDAYLVTGTDEHGQKIMESAHAHGKEPQEFVDKIAAETIKLWEKLDINYDTFIRSTGKQHEKDVVDIFNKLYEQGDIYKGEYKGYYCTPCLDYPNMQINSKNYSKTTQNFLSLPLGKRKCLITL